MTDIQQLEKQLNSFDAEERKQALSVLNEMTVAEAVDIALVREIANMHCHTFYSFNGYGMSPSALAWMAKRDGIKLLGIVDFDVLDAVEEFLDACEMLGVRASAGMETRVFIPQFSTREINSPGEPGVSYHMGVGFTNKLLPDKGKAVMDDMRSRAERRNRGLVERLNAHLAPLVLDYEKDVLPLTPAGNATERHMLTALLNVTETQIGKPIEFWADKLAMSEGEVSALFDNLPTIKNMIRKKLMKRGGVGYVQPGPDTFPNVDDVHKLILSAGALPCITWLDGTSDGEQDIEELLDLLIEKGAAALNIVPDRNWNIADSEIKALKVENLYHIVDLAQKLDLPLNVGTEMNSFGLKFVDSFDVEELAPVKEAFMDGAYFIYGHTIMQRFADLGYQSDWAKGNFATRGEKNQFYTTIGKAVEPENARQALSGINDKHTPVTILNLISQLP